MIKINKKLSYILMALVLVMLMISGKNSLTSEGKIESDKRTKDNYASVFLNDKLLEFSNSPVIKEGKVYVPIDEFAKQIDAKVKFKLSEKIIIKKDDKNLVINTKDNTVITEDNKTFFMNTINKGRKSLLPIDIVSKHFGFNVSSLSKNTIKIYNNSKDVKNTKDEDNKKDETSSEVTSNENKEASSGDNNNVEPPKEEITQPKEDTATEKPEEPKKKVAYLTFDDGPNANTTKILDVLKEKNVKATFFMLGSSIMSHKDVAKRISDEGHGLGIHSMTHNFKSVYASPDSFMHEMTTTNDVLYEATGKKTLLLRAPYGSKPYMKQEYRDLATSLGYRIWDWNVDSRDSIKKNTTPDEVYNEVANQVANKDEAIILFHDKEHTLEALPRIIDFLISSGFEVKKLDTEITPLNFWNDIR